MSFLDIINSLKYVFLLTTLLVFLIERNCNRKDIKVFIFLLFTLTLVVQTIGITLISFISLLATIILFIAFTRKNTYLLPACNIIYSISLVIPLFISKVLYIHDIDFRIILSFAYIALTTIKSTKQNKVNVDAVRKGCPVITSGDDEDMVSAAVATQILTDKTVYNRLIAERD